MFAVLADVSIVYLQRCKITQKCPTDPRRQEKKRNCEICLDRKNEDRQEEKIGF